MHPIGSTTAAVTLAAAVLGLAACGSSSTPAQTAGSSKLSQGLEFAQCMRSHGVTNFPDPTGSGGGGLRIQRSQTQGSGPSLQVNGVSVSSPSFQSAMQVCRKDLPNGGHPTAAQTARARSQVLAMAACMRSHGVPNFPDPKFVTGPGGGAGVELTGVNPQSPAFQAAQKTCMARGLAFKSP